VREIFCFDWKSLWSAEVRDFILIAFLSSFLLQLVLWLLADEFRFLVSCLFRLLFSLLFFVFCLRLLVAGGVSSVVLLCGREFEHTDFWSSPENLHYCSSCSRGRSLIRLLLQTIKHYHRFCLRARFLPREGERERIRNSSGQISLLSNGKADVEDRWLLERQALMIVPGPSFMANQNHKASRLQTRW
jgi:hypothetical protein